jgi:hypothetical protein
VLRNGRRARVSAGCSPRFPTVTGAWLVPAVRACALRAYDGLRRTIERAGVRMAMLGSQGHQTRRSLARGATECMPCQSQHSAHTREELGQISAHAITRSPISRWRWVTRWPRNTQTGGNGSNTQRARGPSAGVEGRRLVSVVNGSMKFSASIVQTNASMFIMVGARRQAQVVVVVVVSSQGGRGWCVSEGLNGFTRLSSAGHQ